MVYKLKPMRYGYAFYYSDVFSMIIYHHMPRERRCLRHSGAHIRMGLSSLLRELVVG
jgi:hypothetical protein